MRKKIAMRISVFLGTVLLLTGIFAGNLVVFAADSTVKIYIGSSTTARHHMAISLRDTSEEYRFEVKGYEVESSSYKSSNPSAFQIVETGTGRCRVKTVAEGTGLVILTIKTKENKTLTEKVFVSVYQKIASCQAKAAKATDVYRGASARAGVENADKKGILANHQRVTVLASCGDYYLFRTNDGSVYEDDKDTGFAKKSDIKILAGSVILQDRNISIEKGKSRKVNAEVMPALASDKEVQWSSGNPKIATVGSDGQVYGKAEGTTIISAITKDGSDKAETTYVSVYKRRKDVQGCLKSGTSLYAVGNNQVSVGTGNKGAGLTIAGTCGKYYRIRVSKELLPVSCEGFCYVLKTKVTVPVLEVKLQQNRITALSGKRVQLAAIVSPDIADNKKVTWRSSNKKVARVDSKGCVTAKKAGKAVITVTSVDGAKTDTCEVLVTERKQSSKGTSKPTLFLEAKGLDRALLTIGNVEVYNGVTLYVNGKKYKEYKCKKRSGAITKTLDGLKINKTYKVKVRTFIRKGNQKIYSKMSDTRKFTAGRISISANVTKNKTITVSWGKIKGANSYRIYRAGKKSGKYKWIKTVKGSKKSYMDTAVKLNKTYYYKVKPIDSKGVKASSNIDYATACKLKSAAKYIAKKYKFVCTQKKKNMNSYNVNGIYPPVKYKFAKGNLEIHVYLEFVTYFDTGRKDIDKEKIYEKRKVNVQSEVSASDYVSMFKAGLKKAYAIKVIGGKGDFKKGVNFNTKLVIHEKKAGKKYNAKQKFMEVLIGGECPDCTQKGDHWYHADTSPVPPDYAEYGDDVPAIYMPTNEQVRANADPGARIPCIGERYEVTAAHELGHALGLDDAYYEDGYDRCADNSETGYEYICGNYDNIMKCCMRYKRMNANEIEMILEAVNKNTGIPDFASQSFKTYPECKISRVIKNHRDYQKDHD